MIRNIEKCRREKARNKTSRSDPTTANVIGN